MINIRDLIVNQGFAKAILGGGSAKVEEKTITENGTYTAPDGVDGFNPVTVAVPTPEIKLQEKTITENGEYTADAGFDGLLKVLVDVASSGAANIVCQKSSLYKDSGSKYTITHKNGVVPDIVYFYQTGKITSDGMVCAIAFKDGTTFGNRYSYKMVKSGSNLTGEDDGAGYWDSSRFPTMTNWIQMTETNFTLPQRASCDGSCYYAAIWINPPQA